VTTLPTPYLKHTTGMPQLKITPDGGCSVRRKKKWPGLEAGHSPLPTTKFTNNLSCSPTALCDFVACRGELYVHICSKYCRRNFLLLEHQLCWGVRKGGRFALNTTSSCMFDITTQNVRLTGGGKKSLYLKFVCWNSAEMTFIAHEP